MKRKIVVLLILVLLLLTGCLLYDKNDTSKVDNQQESIVNNVVISGSFVVTVRDIIPDYCLDDFTPQVAVVTQFQNRPFTVYLVEKLASEIEIGKTYVFTIDDTSIGKLDKETFQQSISPVIAIEKYKIKVINIRLANEEELGLGSSNLQYSYIKLN